MALEGLYLTNFMSASLEDRIGDWQREEEVSKRLDLELGFDIALARGAPEAESRAAVEVSLQAFRAQQQETRREAIARTRDALAADRMRTVFQGPFLGGVR
jgi:hypothetical protein